jgi:hypothetical protein
LQPAMPSTASSAELATIALRVARPRTFHLRVSGSFGVDNADRTRSDRQHFR